MRLIPIDFTQTNLFSKKVCNESASFFKKHKESYKRMIVEQGRHFWIYFSVSFKSYCLNNRILEIKGISTDMTFTKLIEEVLEVTDQMLTNGHVKNGVTLCEDLITVFQYRSFIDEIQSQSIMTNPFYMRDSEDTFCRLFGKPMEDKTLHLIKVVKTLQFLLHLGGCLFEMLRLWLQAEECKQDVTLYWKPPPEKPFHMFGENSPTLKKACTVINKYEQAMLDKTMYQLQEDTREGRNLINIKFEDDSADSGDDDPEKNRFKSKKVNIVLENEDTKEVKKNVKLKYPRWHTSSYELDPKECPGCKDHLECIRKQVIEEGFVLPEVFEVHYEPNFHVKIRHCSHCSVRMSETECDGPSHRHERKSLSIAGAQRKEKGMTRTALKQIAKKERRIQRKEKAGKESLDKLETKGLQKFVDECRQVPGFIEELERTKPKKLVGVPLPKQLKELPAPNPNQGVCRWRILDDDGNEILSDDEEEEASKEKKDADETKESQEEETKQESKEAQVAEPEDRESKNKEPDSDKVMTEQKDDPPKEEALEKETIVEMKEKEEVPVVVHPPAEAGCCIDADGGSSVNDEDEGTPVDRPEDHPAVNGETTSDSVNLGTFEGSVEMKIHKLRVCGFCSKKEDTPKTYKKCRECHLEKVKPGKYYCSRECQGQDWKRRHCQEHLKRKCKLNNNNEPAKDEGLSMLDINKLALLNDVE